MGLSRPARLLVGSFVAGAVCAAAALAAAPATAATVERPSTAAVSITIDSSRAPDLAGWVNSLRPTLETWYPQMSTALALPEYNPPSAFSIIVENCSGVASAGGTRIRLCAPYFRGRKDVGAVIHEMVHVIQQARGGAPIWLIEGIADYGRHYVYPGGALAKPGRGASYTDGYRTTAYFLNWVQARYDQNFVHKMNVAAHTRYSSALWQQYTGRTVDQLWNEMINS
jgi:hypothetical protein